MLDDASLGEQIDLSGAMFYHDDLDPDELKFVVGSPPSEPDLPGSGTIPAAVSPSSLSSDPHPQMPLPSTDLPASPNPYRATVEEIPDVQAPVKAVHNILGSFFLPESEPELVLNQMDNNVHQQGMHVTEYSGIY